MHLLFNDAEFTKSNHIALWILYYYDCKTGTSVKESFDIYGPLSNQRFFFQALLYFKAQ